MTESRLQPTHTCCTLVLSNPPALAGGGSVKFGTLLGISHGSLSELENNKNNPSADTLAALVRHTDISITWLLTGEGDMTRPPREDIYSAGGVGETFPGYPAGGISDRMKDILNKVAEIMQSEDKGTQLALEQNVNTFHEKIVDYERLKRLECEVDTLKKALGYVTLPSNTGKAGEGT